MSHYNHQELCEAFMKGTHVRIIRQDAETYGRIGEVKDIEETSDPICVTIPDVMRGNYEVYFSPEDLELA